MRSLGRGKLGCFLGIQFRRPRSCWRPTFAAWLRDTRLIRHDGRPAIAHWSDMGSPIIVLGMLLPMIWQAASVNPIAGETVGRLTAVNSLAAAIGALIANFVLLPFVGLWQSFIALAVVFLLTACMLLWKSKQRGLLTVPLLVVVGGSSLMLRIADQYDSGTLRPSENLVRP